MFGIHPAFRMKTSEDIQYMESIMFLLQLDISEEGFNEFNPHLYMLQYCVTLKRQILRLNEDDDNKNLNIEE